MQKNTTTDHGSVADHGSRVPAASHPNKKLAFSELSRRHNIWRSLAAWVSAWVSAICFDTLVLAMAMLSWQGQKRNTSFASFKGEGIAAAQ